MSIPTLIARLRWRWQFRAVRREAARIPLTPHLIAVAEARQGHLNTETGQWADVIVRRAESER